MKYTPLMLMLMLNGCALMQDDDITKTMAVVEADACTVTIFHEGQPKKRTIVGKD